MPKIELSQYNGGNARWEATKAFQELHERGVQLFGVEWLTANEGAINAAVELGFSYDEDIFAQLLMANITFRVMQKTIKSEPTEL